MMMARILTATTLTLGLIFLLGCNSQPPTASYQEQKNATGTPEAPKAVPDTAKPSFKITKVEVTKKSQKMGSGNTIAFSGSELKPTMGTPKKGYVFVIVSFSLEVPSEQLSYDPQKDFVLSDSTAVYSEFMEKDVWMQYNSAKFGKGKYESRRLYLMPSSRVRSAKIHFLDSDYPIESFLSELPK
jgi:hypothetical protein